MKMLFKGNSSRLELLIEKIQSTKETSDIKELENSSSVPGPSKPATPESLAGPSNPTLPLDFTLSEVSSSYSELEESSQQASQIRSDETEEIYFSCSICNENFSKGKQLIDHEQVHSDHLQFSCLYCPRLFKHKRSRDRHTKLHTGDKKYKCLHCDSAFSRSDHLKIHMRTHDSRKPYKCGVCNRGYNTATTLFSHQQNHLKKEPMSGSQTSDDSSSPFLFRCSHCNESFKKYDLLQNHLMAHSDISSPTSQSSVQKTPDYQTHYEDLKTFCLYCSKDFPTKDLLTEHVNTNHKDAQTEQNDKTLEIVSPKVEIFETDNNYLCDRCPMEFYTMQNLNDHFYNEHWLPLMLTNLTDQHLNVGHFMANQSQATDLTKKKKIDDAIDSQLKKQKNYHSTLFDSNEKPFICSCCYVQLPNFKAFLLHMETHMTPTNNFSGFCVFCGESNIDPVSFTNHMFGHAITQVPEYFCCCTCKKAFNQYEKLQKHLLEMHVLTVYKCSICNEIFDTKLAMKMHFTSKHTNGYQHFKCHFCTNQVFHDKLSAELHISMKHLNQFATCMSGNQLQLAPLLLQNQQKDLECNSPKTYENRGFCCSLCQKTFDDPYSQYVHFAREHNDKQGKYLVESIKDQLRSPSLAAKSICEIIPSSNKFVNNKKETDEDSVNKCNASTSEQCFVPHDNLNVRSKNGLQKSHQVHYASKIKHKCNICDDIFSSSVSLADHKLKHCKIVDGNNCLQCKSLLVDEQTFYSHQLKHSNGLVKTNTQILLPTICIICSQTLQTDVEIKLHAKFHLSYLHNKKIKCGNCGKIIHDDVFDNDGSKNTTCKECIVQFTSDKEKIVPYEKIDCDNPEETENQCHLCKQILGSQGKLQLHLIEHNFCGMNQYSCYVCSSVFTAASGLQNHMLEHNIENKPYECPNCHLTFFFRAELDNHRFTHTIQHSPSSQFDFTDNSVDTKHKNNFQYNNKTCQFCSSYFEKDHSDQCPYKICPKTEMCDSDNNIKEECSLDTK